MVCLDVTRELAAPTGQIDAVELKRHLAACPRCAEWARQAERLDRAWDATRPSEPSPAAFQTLWARVCESVDAAPVEPAPAPARSWKRAGLAAAILAQAAVLLVAGLVVFRGGANPQGPNPGQVAQNDKPAGANSVYDHEVLLSVNPGEPVMWSGTGEEIKVKPLKQMEGLYVVSADLELLNAFEALAE